MDRFLNTIEEAIQDIKDGKVVIGWAIIKQDKKGAWQFMLYVKRPYRRKKIGTKLYKRAKKYMRLTDREITVFRTDNQNTKFFDSVRRRDRQ